MATKETSYFFSNIEKDTSSAIAIDTLTQLSIEKSAQIFLINKPLSDDKYEYSEDSAIILIPKHKIIFINFKLEQSKFADYQEDIIEDISSISDKFRYKEVIGRARSWRDKLFSVYNKEINQHELISFLSTQTIKDPIDQRNCELIISLLTGSINDIDRIKDKLPETLLDKIKQKIILFDGDQTRFIYKQLPQKSISIQGLSGTGKTELLLHKIKDIYTKEEGKRILLTCHNKVLADNLSKRIPDFFNFMKVEKQIEWNEKLMCVHAWGSSSRPFSGAYRYICHFYKLPFFPYSPSQTFGGIITIALKKIREIKKEETSHFRYAFDYILIDESQDFPKEFIELCTLIAKEKVFVAGDIFQSIFETKSNSSIEPDFLLSKCYRTDPRTLMFAHSLGMGLFEKEKLQWLDDRNLESCGYIVKRKDRELYLTREPLRRFEDLKTESFDSAKITNFETTTTFDLENKILDIIINLRTENPTVEPDDIAVIMLDVRNESYTLSDNLAIRIQRDLGWKVNKAYESKKKEPNTLFISNRNNVKGLEFPFVIVLTANITSGRSYRNALYTMMTRSFLQSHLIIYRSTNQDLIKNLENGLTEIMKHGYIHVIEPTKEEIEKIKMNIESTKENISLYDSFIKICEDLQIEEEYRNFLLESYKKFDPTGYEQSILEEFIISNYRLLKRAQK